jgi:hypothetical protein
MLSLAFGRPPFLPISHYKNVPFPPQSQLEKYKPHSRQQGSAIGDGFGAFFLIQTLNLSKIVGRATAAFSQDTKIRLNSRNAEVAAVKGELRLWFEEILQVRNTRF